MFRRSLFAFASLLTAGALALAVAAPPKPPPAPVKPAPPAVKPAAAPPLTMPDGSPIAIKAHDGVVLSAVVA